MKNQYAQYPESDTPYIAHLVPYGDLTEEDRKAADALFNGTPITGRKMTDYLYLCPRDGGVIGRQFGRGSKK